MKKTILSIILLTTSINIFYSQTNIYPSTGNVGIGTVLPGAPLHIENNGILLKLSNNSNNFAYSGIDGLGFYLEQVADTPNKSQIRLQARNSNQGNYAQLFIDGANSRFNFINGNVGIGTSTPSNIQGWNRVLDVSGTNHSKILATSENSLYKNGIFTHSSWHGGGGFIGTESNHSLFLLAGYDPKMTILTNGNIGIGTKNPNGKLEISGNSAVYSDFASYSGTTINNILPNGKEPTLIINENPTGTLQYAVAGQTTYRGGLSFGKGGPGIYSINPNPAGSGFYGELRFHTTYWNGTDYNNSDRMVIKLDGNVGIGTTNPTSKLTVAGNINSREVKVSVDAGADFVFEKDYALPSLQEVEKFVIENKHLPEIASAKEMQKEGINLSEMNIKLLQKIEEQTLYLIELSKEVNKLKAKISELKKK